MKQKTYSSLTYWLGVVVVGLTLGLILQFAQAWTEPTQNPPGGNVGAPLNTGDLTQTKGGGLIINQGNKAYEGIKVSGSVGINAQGYTSAGIIGTGGPYGGYFWNADMGVKAEGRTYGVDAWGPGFGVRGQSGTSTGVLAHGNIAGQFWGQNSSASIGDGGYAGKFFGSNSRASIGSGDVGGEFWGPGGSNAVQLGRGDWSGVFWGSTYTQGGVEASGDVCTQLNGRKCLSQMPSYPCQCYTEFRCTNPPYDGGHVMENFINCGGGWQSKDYIGGSFAGYGYCNQGHTFSRSGYYPCWQ